MTTTHNVRRYVATIVIDERDDCEPWPSEQDLTLFILARLQEGAYIDVEDITVKEKRV